MDDELTWIEPGTRLLYGGNRWATVSEEIARRFEPGDRLLVVQRTGEILHVPKKQWEIADQAVSRAADAFQGLNAVEDDRISDFFERFASRLADDAVWASIAKANAADVESATKRGRSTTRLIADEKMRHGMIAGLRVWRDAPSSRGQVIETVRHDGWRVENVKSGYGAVGFVFEGRPNVFADGAGVLRSGNASVMRIGADALGTAQTLVELALAPALAESRLPEGAVTLVESPERAAGWALFSNPKLGLAVARGSGRAVSLLGSLAGQAGIPVSLHGTGGAWIVADETANPDDLKTVVYHSTDRKVCNTVNVICIHEARADELVAATLRALEERGEKIGYGYKLHVVDDSLSFVPKEIFERTVGVMRAEGWVEEPLAEPLSVTELGREWEWEQTPEVSLKIVSSTDEAIQLFNDLSPRFAASLISSASDAQDQFFKRIDAPFVGNGFTRWVDGQYALNRPELGLSNWEYGRLFGRGGVLSGDSVYTVRSRVTQERFDIHR
jgi:glutamate-5-semialdehyde dehydrogenase